MPEAGVEKEKSVEHLVDYLNVAIEKEVGAYRRTLNERSPLGLKRPNIDEVFDSLTSGFSEPSEEIEPVLTGILVRDFVSDRIPAEGASLLRATALIAAVNLDSLWSRLINEYPQRAEDFNKSGSFSEAAKELKAFLVDNGHIKAPSEQPLVVQPIHSE